jgi:hypothetical protein
VHSIGLSRLVGKRQNITCTKNQNTKTKNNLKEETKRMNKKILALLLAFAMLFSTVSTVFANEAVTTTAALSTDAEALKTMNVLQGAGDGVTAAYLATTPDRLQSAVMFLRLKGLEEEAKAFTGTDNFADGNIAWGEGRAIMAYLKAHPELGWVGINTNGKTVFSPYEKIETAQYYKVMLEALGTSRTQLQ